MIKVIFLDIDDTLLSFSGYVKKAMENGFSEFGLPSYDASMYPVFCQINNQLWRQIELGTLTYEELLKIRWNLIFRALHISFDGELFETYFRESLFTSAIPMPHARELLEYLSPRYLLCAASNGPYEQQYNRLRIGGMEGYFSHFFISSQIGAQKPDTAFFDHCFRILRETGLPDLQPEEALIIGDSLTSDIAGGKAYGLKTCLYMPAPLADMECPDADLLVSDLLELTHLLNGNEE